MVVWLMLRNALPSFISLCFVLCGQWETARIYASTCWIHWLQFGCKTSRGNIIWLHAVICWSFFIDQSIAWSQRIITNNTKQDDAKQTKTRSDQVISMKEIPCPMVLQNYVFEHAIELEHQLRETFQTAVLLLEVIFGLRVLLHTSVCVCVRPCVNEVVRAITRHPFKLGSPNKC